jgi:hypothetical protein
LHGTDVKAPVLAIGLVSAAAIAYELLLIRLFALVHWHHLVATAIALALLGYGVSGTLLAVLRPWLLRHFAVAFLGNALLFTLSMPLCISLAQQIAFDPLAIAWDAGQWGSLALIFLTLSVPFLAAANCIGLALSAFPAAIPRLYGVDLLGAGVGAAALILALSLLHPAHALWGIYALGCGTLIAGAARTRRHARSMTAGVLLVLAPAALWLRPAIEPAPYKDLARALEVLGAEAELALHGVEGTVTVVRNQAVPARLAPGLSLLATGLPPEQRAVFVDGDGHGVISDFSPTRNTGDHLLETPRVVVLNAGTGELVQQALIHGAAQVTAVEPNRLLYAARCAHYAALAPGLCDSDRVSWQLQTPRTLLNRARGGPPPGGGGGGAPPDANGLDALALDFDLTVEAFGRMLDHLRPGGLVAIDLPIRAPPRLTTRLIATARDALAARGAARPAAHIAVIRGWRRAMILFAPAPLAVDRLGAIRAFSRARAFDPVWLPDIGADEVNRVQRLSAPLYYQAARRQLAPAPADGGAPVRYRVAPVDDDSPFPHRFTRWAELGDALGSRDATRLAQLDTGLLVGLGTIALVALFSVLLILAPLHALAGDPRSSPGMRRRTLAYFALVGVAFLFIEIAWIHRFELLLDHPVLAASVVLAVFLVFAGMGSLWSQRRVAAYPRGVLWAGVAGIGLLNLGYLLGFPEMYRYLADLPLVLRIIATVALLAPLAFLMGMPFPIGLRTTGAIAPGLVPWAWGINGCASVTSAASVPLLASEFGLGALVLVAVTAYLLLPLALPAAPAHAGPAADSRSV